MNQTCGCPSPDASDDDMDDEDGLSERSYNGPDADDYYRLRELREDRKRELIEEKEEQEELMEGDLEEDTGGYQGRAGHREQRRRSSAFQLRRQHNVPVKHCFCEWARGRKYVEFTYRVPDKDYGSKAKAAAQS